MRKLTPSLVIPILSAVIAASACADEMFENLKFGDTKKTVQHKLQNNKRFTSPPPTMLGRTGLNGFFKTKKSLAGLNFSVHFEWSEQSPLTLQGVDLYSAPGDRGKLQAAFSEARRLITDLYGPAKFSNGLPQDAILTEVGMIQWGAAWFYGSDAVMLGMGKTAEGLCLVIGFRDEQPQLTRN